MFYRTGGRAIRNPYSADILDSVYLQLGPKGDDVVVDENSLPGLQSDSSDYVAIAAKSVLGAVPFAGSLLVELAGTVIPNQRIDRIAKFAAHLEQRLGAVEQDQLRAQLHNENFTDLMEESLRQAARAVSDERKQYIAALVANSISSDDITFIESKHILRFLGEINDIEVLWLRYFLVPTLGGDKAFREKHKAIFDKKYSIMGCSRRERDDATLQDSYKEHLVQLGLLMHRYGTDHKTKTPEFEMRIGGGFKVTGHEITPLGQLLLQEIGLTEQANTAS